MSKSESERDGYVVTEPLFGATDMAGISGGIEHPDPCDETDGPLRAVPGSHKFGRLGADAMRSLRDRAGETACIVDKGGALLMKPLLLHASSKATGNCSRRVLHFVFGPPALPCGLIWKIAG